MKDTTEGILKNLLDRRPALERCAGQIEAAFEILASAFKGGGKVLICGNGGSAADAEHIAGELINKFRRRRPLPPGIAARLPPGLAAELVGALPAVSLVSMSGALTAIGNDISWKLAFAQQVVALARPGDVLIAISTSGNSANCVAAAETMKAAGGKTVALTGAGTSRLSDVCDVAVRVPETETFKVQELHLPVYHALCAMLEEELF